MSERITQQLNQMVGEGVLFSPPSPEQANQYEIYFMDLDYSGTKIYGIPTWWPKTLIEAEDWAVKYRGQKLGSA